ncbi:hypothetical protein PRBRB14_12580 [Hallella multisaccharivorax DSM 17128]|nr:hypothetical protein PRBRB14_12580 [Hallella multisaccharivorax DSM 17128]
MIADIHFLFKGGSELVQLLYGFTLAAQSSFLYSVTYHLHHMEAVKGYPGLRETRLDDATHTVRKIHCNL